MYRHWAYDVIVASFALAVPFMIGCESTAGDPILSQDGVLTLEINRTSGSTVAKVTAHVGDNRLASLLTPYIVLAEDQVLSINDVPLDASTLTALGLDAQYAATISAVDDSHTYTIAFDNTGVVTSLSVYPPEDFANVSPDALTEVSTDGFDLEWDVPDDDDSTIRVDIAGKAYSYNEATGAVTIVDHTVSLTNLPDEGSLGIGSADLSTLLTGRIEVTLSRTKTISQSLGFSSGTIILRISKTLSLTLVEPEE